MKRKHKPTLGTTSAHAIITGGTSWQAEHFATMARKIAAIRRQQEAPTKPTR